MAKMTLLEMVQDILSDMDSDEVNSISDTQEATQIAQIVKSTFYNIIDGKDFPHFYEMFQLETVGTSKPNYLKIPDNIENVSWVKYNTKEKVADKNRYVKIKYLTPEEFVNHVDQRDSTDSKIQVITEFSGVPLNIFKDRPPEYFTSFDEEYIVFDNYDLAIENHKRGVSFTINDSFTPDLPVQMFSYLLNEAKSTAFLTLKQMANPKAEAQSVSQKRRMSQEAWKLKNGITYPHYGRK